MFKSLPNIPKADRTRIKVGIIQNSLTQAWLIARLEEQGISVDKKEMCLILNGNKKANERTNMIVDRSISILDRYERQFRQS